MRGLISSLSCVFDGGPLRRHRKISLPSVQTSTLSDALKNLLFKAHDACAFTGCLVLSRFSSAG